MKLLCAVPLAFLVATPGAAQRVGFRDDFSATEGWEAGVWPGTTSAESITSDGHQATFTTLAGTFMAGASAAWAPEWPDWDENTPPGLAMIVKKYPVTVDLARYHYLVVRMTHSGTYMALAVNGWDTKACYTTGLHAVDLRDLQKPSLQGQQPIELRLTFLNTGGRVVLDEVRLVESLTPEEREGFIPAGLDLRLECREPLPYHGLEALNARAGAPIRSDLPEERTVYRDTSTEAVVWKLTRGVRTELADSFSADGSVLPIYNRSYRGFVVYDLRQGAMREFPDLRGSPVLSRADPSIMYLLQSAEVDDKARYTIQAVDLRTGAVSQIAEWDSSDGGGAEFGPSPYSGRLILGLKEGRALYLIDPQAPADGRVRRVPLPMRMKGSYYSHDDRRINWQRCYFFQRWQMDLGTGDVQLAHYPTYGGHEIFGRGSVVGRYVTMMLTHKVGLLPCDETNGNQVRIWSNWRTDVPSDYGQLSDDDRWLVTNGTDGAVAGKRLLIDGRETEFLDWGFKPGSTLYHKVVAVNKRGVAAAPATVRVETPQMETATVELGIEQAVLSGGLERAESQGVECAFLPTTLADEAPRPKAMWEFDVPLDGVYYAWARYTTLDAKRVSLFWVDCDGEDQLGGSNWRLRFPNTLTRHLDGVRPGEETWFTDKMVSGWWAGPFDFLSLGAGSHVLSVAFEPTHAPNGPRLSAVYLSSDPSYRPPGFDPRVDFRK